MAILISIVIILSLWSITNTLEKIGKRITDRQDQQKELLEEMKSLLMDKND